MMADQSKSAVNDFYQGKSVFVTGGSGFMGKVLVEKLLYSCPGLREIFFLIRPKKGRAPQLRLQEMFDLPMFQRIRAEKPEVLTKVIPVHGDVTSDELGLSSDPLFDRLLGSTSIVFHLAATVRMNESLKDALDMNTAGTRRVIALCHRMPQLRRLVYLSTTFCYCEKEVVYETVHDSPHDPNDLIRCAAWMDPEMLEKITPDLLHPHPNTYTFSKRLAEMLIRDEHEKLPVAIARPCLVSPAVSEPLPGWVDNLNGPIGFMIGTGKGIIRSMMCNANYKAELIPVDFAINGLITIPYVEEQKAEKPQDVPVYNLTAAPINKITWAEALQRSMQGIYGQPFEAGIWYPNGQYTTNKMKHLLIVFLFQWIPACLIDLLCLICGQKRVMVRIQKRIFAASNALSFFAMHKCDFRGDNFLGIAKYLEGSDSETFPVDTSKACMEGYVFNLMMGARQYYLKEPLSTLPKARLQLKCLYFLDRGTKLLLSLWLGWMLVKWIGFADLLSEYWSLKRAEDL